MIASNLNSGEKQVALFFFFIYRHRSTKKGTCLNGRAQTTQENGLTRGHLSLHTVIYTPNAEAIKPRNNQISVG